MKTTVLIFFIFFGLCYASPRYIEITGADSKLKVLDKATGLEWTKEYAAAKTWQQALDYCEALNYAGNTDWKLPNSNELISLINIKKYNPASDFPSAATGYFWSSSSCVSAASSAWIVYFSNGNVTSYDKASAYAVRCVRQP